MPGPGNVRTSVVARQRVFERLPNVIARRIEFFGKLNTLDRGGWARFFVAGGGRRPADDLSEQEGILLDFETMKHSTYGPAPVAFTLALDSGDGQRCSLLASFAVAKTEHVERMLSWLPISRFVLAGARSDYGVGLTAVPSVCTPGVGTEAEGGGGGGAVASSLVSLASVSRLSVGINQQPGEFNLTIHAVEARPTAPHIAVPNSLTPRHLLTTALQTSRALVAEAGNGVGAAQMDGMSAAVLELASLQSRDETLAVVVNHTRREAARFRVATLQDAITARLDGKDYPIDDLLLPSEAEKRATNAAAAEDESRVFSAVQTVWMVVGMVCGIVLALLLNGAIWRCVQRRVKAARDRPRVAPDRSNGVVEVARATAAPLGVDVHSLEPVENQLMSGKLTGVKGQAAGYVVHEDRPPTPLTQAVSQGGKRDRTAVNPSPLGGSFRAGESFRVASD